MLYRYACPAESPASIIAYYSIEIRLCRGVREFVHEVSVCPNEVRRRAVDGLRLAEVVRVVEKSQWGYLRREQIPTTFISPLQMPRTVSHLPVVCIPAEAQSIPAARQKSATDTAAAGLRLQKCRLFP